MRTVKEVSELTGVSVRTLHHYDAIGLLRPTKVTEAGYRLYDDTAIGRLQSILLFRELQFSLKEIRSILESPNYNRSEALRQQIELLELQRAHIGGLIAFAREILNKGAENMEFHVFDKSEIEAYKAEAKAKWGGTAAYREYSEREKSGGDPRESADLLMAQFAQLGVLRDLPPADPAVQERIQALQSFLTSHYYTCTIEVLRGLGSLYVEDARFKRNIDKAGGEGTAEFVKQAIDIFCAGK